MKTTIKKQRRYVSIIMFAILILTILALALGACTKPDNQKYAQLTALGTDTITWQVGSGINQQTVTDWWTMCIPVNPGDTVRLAGGCQVYLTITEGDYVIFIQQCMDCMLEYIN